MTINGRNITEGGSIAPLDQALDSQPHLPSYLPPAVIKDARRDYAIDQQLGFRRLEFICQSLGLFSQPKLFDSYDGEAFRYRHVLTVPMQTDQYVFSSLFVVVNEESSSLAADDYEERHLVMNAFRLALHDRRIVRSDDRHASRPARDRKWTFEDKHGPFIDRRDDFLAVINWDKNELVIPPKPNTRLSIPSVEEMKTSEELIGVLNGISPADEISNTSVFYVDL